MKSILSLNSTIKNKDNSINMVVKKIFTRDKKVIYTLKNNTFQNDFIINHNDLLSFMSEYELVYVDFNLTDITYK